MTTEELQQRISQLQRDSSNQIGDLEARLNERLDELSALMSKARSDVRLLESDVSSLKDDVYHLERKVDSK